MVIEKSKYFYTGQKLIKTKYLIFNNINLDNSEKILTDLNLVKCYMAISMHILMQRVILLTIFSTIMDISNAQNISNPQDRVDMFASSPQIIELPIDYLQSQSGQQQLHPFKIKFQQLSIDWSCEECSSEPIDRLYYITSYFYSILIKVQDISQNQTKFPKDINDGLGYCFEQIVPPIYTQEGFSTEDQDLIIFTNQLLDGQEHNALAGACVVQRRPIYGLLNFDHWRIRTYQDNANFHNTLIRFIHSVLHIVGLNTNFIVDGLYTQVAQIQNHYDDQTFFFASAFSNERLKVKDVIVKDYGDLRLSAIKTNRVKRAVRQIFECPQTEETYAALEHVDGYIRFHWHSQIYQSQFMVFAQVSRENMHKQKQQLRMSKLTWAMLQDTGFYQFVDNSLVDNFRPRTFQTIFNQYSGYSGYSDRTIISKCQMHKRLYRQQQFQLVPHCNVYGTSMLNSYYDIRSKATVQDKTRFQHMKCTKMSSKFRCLQILYMPDFQDWLRVYQYCTYAECIDNNTIRIMFSGQWLTVVCTRQQAGQDKDIQFRTNFTVHCPSDFDAFCGQKFCENWCNKQGVCINGQCHYPQNRFQTQLNIQNLQYNFYHEYTDVQTGEILTGKVCDFNCLQCIGINKCKAHRKNNNQKNRVFQLCHIGFKTCLARVKKIVPCFENYFFHTNKCFRCDSTCSHCQQTYGSNQMINFCKNCEEGSFPFRQICQSCQFQNCMLCNQKGNCEKCKLDYYIATLQNSTQKCLRCLSNCGICDPNNISICLGCGEGRFLSQAINQCLSCIPYCKKCLNVTECIQCYKGFIKRENKCVRPCELPCRQCIAGQPTKCLSCASYHVYNSSNNSCQQIAIKSKQNCPIGYYQAGKQNNCIKIPLDNCLIAKTAYIFGTRTMITVCSLCAKGYFKTQSRKCQRCPQGCYSCFQFDICDICEDGFSSPKNRDGSRNTAKCIKCGQNCLQCPASPDQCQLCTNNYSIIGSSCHSINQIKVQLILEIDYALFMVENKVQAIKNLILKLLDQKSKIQITTVSNGSLKVLAIVSRIFQDQVEKDCMLSYNLTTGFNNAGSDFNIPLIGASFVNNIAQCDDFSPQKAIQIIYFISAGASILIIILIIVIICLVRKLSNKEKIILKYQELQSRPQYLADSTFKIGF